MSSPEIAEKPSLTDTLLLATPGLIWGASFLLIAEGLKAMGPYGVTFTRIAIGFLTLSLFPAARRGVSWDAWPHIALVGLVWMAFPLTLFPLAEQRVSSALTGMLNGANPLFTALVATLLTRRLPSRGILVGLGVGLFGAVLTAWPSLGEGRSSVIGVVLILAALVSYGFALNLAVPLQHRHGVLPVLWRALGTALLLTAPLGVPEVLRADLSATGPLLSLLALGVFGTGIAYVVLTTVAGRLGATRASATTFLIPGVALALGVLVRNETVAPLAILGAAVCIAGAWLMRQAKGR
ncbi:MAG: DMT family transporter [Thermoanaerobaculia bacterium]|nr:DMT family transporter [Thermoanaerobaculia bacterium]